MSRLNHAHHTRSAIVPFLDIFRSDQLNTHLLQTLHPLCHFLFSVFRAILRDRRHHLAAHHQEIFRSRPVEKWTQRKQRPTLPIADLIIS